MKKKTVGKMTLNKETVRLMDQPEELEELRRVMGGDSSGDTRSPCQFPGFCGKITFGC